MSLCLSVCLSVARGIHVFCSVPPKLFVPESPCTSFLNILVQGGLLEYTAGGVTNGVYKDSYERRL